MKEEWELMNVKAIRLKDRECSMSENTQSEFLLLLDPLSQSEA